MDAFVDTLVQLLIDWGYVGLFISALLAGSIIPFSSEIVMVALVKVGLSPALCVLSATLGNTLGGMTCYYMGRLGRIDWIEKYFKVKREKIERMQHFLQGKGAVLRPDRPNLLFPESRRLLPVAAIHLDFGADHDRACRDPAPGGAVRSRQAAVAVPLFSCRLSDLLL